MKQQVLTRKNIVFIFTVLLFFHVIHVVAKAQELRFIEGETTTREISENAAVGTNVGDPLTFSNNSCRRYRLLGPDARSFKLVRVYRGVQLKTKSAFDYETKNSYEVRIIAASAGSSDAITVIINIINVNEAPMFDESNSGVDRIRRSIPESTASGTNIGNPVSATDPDSNSTLTYSLDGPNADMFSIDSDMGQLKTKALLDYEAFDSEPRAYSVNVQASDGAMSTETEVWIDVEPVNEFAPVFIEGDATTREIHEKEAVGTNVGKPVSATDMDMSETLEYSLSEASTDTFEVDSSTGQLRIKAKLDYETKPVHTVKVVASDGRRVGSIIVTVRVLTDFVEVPDRSLAAMIRHTLGLAAEDGITEQTMLRLTVLDADGDSRLVGLREIEDLTGLEYAKNLTTLFLTSNSVRDLTPLVGLTKLTTLEIYGNKVVFLTPLKDLTNLKKLQLGFNWIHDITPLAGLTNLTELLLRSNNRIKDLTALRGLTNLRTLNLAENMITDIRPLKGLTNLRTLDLRNNARLTDISPLSGLVNLETLSLKGCAITDFSPLANLTADIDIDVSGGSAPAMSGNSIDFLVDPAILKMLDRDTLQAQLQRLHAENDGALKYQRAIAILEAVLVSTRPDETLLLANYPNPFNPETWIPYHLAKATDVQITIYNAHGIVVRHLELGHQSTGYYTSRSRAAYWDGRNDFGESVVSGVYFYQLQADAGSPMRKMIILK